MKRAPTLAVVAALVAAVFVAPVRAARTKPTPCPGGRYPVSDPLVPGGATPDAVVVDGTQVSVDSGCTAVTAKRKVTRTVTTLAAHWDGCGTLTGPTRLVVKIDAATCKTLTGRFTNRKGKVNRVLGAQIDMPAGAFGGPRDPLPPGAEMVTPDEFQQLQTRPDFHSLDPAQTEADAAALARRDAEDEQVVTDFAAANPTLAPQVLGGVDPNDPTVGTADDGNHTLTFTDTSGTPKTVVTQGTRWARRVVAGGLRTFPTLANQLVLYTNFYDTLKGFDPALVGSLTSPDTVATLPVATVAAMNQALVANFGQYVNLIPLPGGTPPAGYPATCAAEEGSGDGTDRSGDRPSCATHTAHGVYKNMPWPLKFFATCVKDQASRGTCWDFATTGAVELWVAKKYSRWVNLSEQHMNLIMKTRWIPTTYGDGEWPGHALAAMILSHVVLDPFGFFPPYTYPFENQWDYNPSHSRTANDDTRTYTHSCDGYGGAESAFCSDTAGQGRFACTTISFITYCGMFGPDTPTTSGFYPTAYSELWDAGNPDGSLGTMLWALLLFQKPVILGFQVPGSFYPDADGYIHYHGPHCPLSTDSHGKTICVPGTGCECDGGGHAVLVTGAVDNTDLPAGAPPGSGGGYLIIKNSWSECYGDGGYAYMPYDWVKAYTMAAEVVGDIN
jgi:hypothetical protein